MEDLWIVGGDVDQPQPQTHSFTFNMSFQQNFKKKGPI